MKFYSNVVRIGGKILSRGYENGKIFFEKEEYKPTIYLPSNNPDSEFKTIEGEPVEPFVPGTMYEATEYIKMYGKVSNFKFYGMSNWIYNYIANRFPGNMQYDFNDLRIGFLDLEWGKSEDGKWAKTDLANGEITVMTLYYKEQYHVFGVKDYEVTDDDVVYNQYPDEATMLLGFIAFWERIKLDIVSGWYSSGADIPYLVNRIKRVLGDDMENRLSPYGKVLPDRIMVSKTKQINTYDILGVNHIDYMDAYKKFSGKLQENYKLNTIAYEELGEKKIDYSEYGNIHDFYEKDYKKFVDYNIKDVGLLVRLEAKKRLLELVVNLAMTSKVNMVDAFKQTRMWDSIIHAFLLDKKIVVPQRQETGVDLDEGQFEGAYVKDSVPGMYEWVVSFDFASLYPSLIIALNISPDTFVGKGDIEMPDLLNLTQTDLVQMAKDKNLSLAGNGTYYHKKFRGFFAELMVNAFDDRKKYKRIMLAKEDELEQNGHKMTDEEKKKIELEIAKYDVLQSVKKVVANSGYGASGNAGFRYYNRDMAEAVTLSGQMAIQWMEKRFNLFLNNMFKTKDEDYVIISDTDSSYIVLDKLVKMLRQKDPSLDDSKIHDILKKLVDTKITPYINESCQMLCEYLNAFDPNRLNQKLEIIASIGFVVAKKKYAFTVLSSEGIVYNEPLLKVKGIEIVRSSTPEYCRKRLKEAVQLVLLKKNTELRELIAETKKEWFTFGFNEISMPRGCNNLLKYTDKHTIYGSGTPIAVRGALLYNYWLNEKGLTNKYATIEEGDKVKFCYLKTPNPIFENIISFPDVVPEEFGLAKYIDYESQFGVAFLSPIEIIAKAIDLDLDNKNTLDDFFQ